MMMININLVNRTVLTEKGEISKNDEYNPFEHRNQEHANT